MKNVIELLFNNRYKFIAKDMNGSEVWAFHHMPTLNRKGKWVCVSDDNEENFPIKLDDEMFDLRPGEIIKVEDENEE